MNEVSWPVNGLSTDICMDDFIYLNNDNRSGFRSDDDSRPVARRIDARRPRRNAFGPNGAMRNGVPPDDAPNVFLAAAAHKVFVGIEQSLEQRRKTIKVKYLKKHERNFQFVFLINNVEKAETLRSVFIY